MLRLSVILLCTSILVGGGAGIAGDAPDLIWPLDLPTRYLTSNFMEHRPGRYHAGLDLKTQTISGFAARAVEDGWVVRVRTTPNAYGRAVYLRGESGRTYVYAHLSRFNDNLRAKVKAQRARTGSYRTRVEFSPGEVPVRQGEVLGLSGQSGTGGPHLHFEVRDTANRPIDPQAAGFATGDTIAPVITRLRAWPASPRSLIAGRREEHVLSDPDGLSGGQPELRVTGAVAFSARLVDRADIRGHRLEPARITVRLDGEVVYDCENQGFDFSENTAARLEWTDLAGAPERWLHRHPAVQVAGRTGGEWYLGASGDGLAPGRHRIELESVDQAGNRARAHWDVVVAAVQDTVALQTSAWRPEIVSLRLAAADSMSFLELSPFFEVNDQGIWSERPGLRRFGFSPAANDPVLAPLVVFSDVEDLAETQIEAAGRQGLRPLGAARRYMAAAWPLEASLPVLLEHPPGPGAKTWGLYRWRGTKWSWAGTWPAEKGGEVKVKIDRPDLYAALEDNAPPRIEALAAGTVVGPGPASTVAGVTMPAWAVLAVGVGDSGSGLSAGTIAVNLDGQPLIVEPDLPRNRILIEFPDDMAPGGHTVEISVEDRVGHAASRVLSIQAER